MTKQHYHPIDPRVSWHSGISDNPKGTEMMMQGAIKERKVALKHVYSLLKSKKHKVLRGLSESQICMAIQRVGLETVAKVSRSSENENDFLIGIEKARIQSEEN